jgi:ribulose bisphosphate carboxylase small subunit
MNSNHFYIVYKTINTVNNMYYIGVHITENIDDGYIGSGADILKAIKIFGKEKFKREILYIYTSEEHSDDKAKKIMYNKERELVTEKQINDPMCYNRILGGLGTGHICMKDTTYIVKNNEIKKVKKDDIKKYFKKGYEQRYPYGPRKWVTKENRTEAVYLHELENYLSSGWKLGRGKSMTSNTNWVTKDGLSKMVKVTELQQYLNKGYKQGRNIEKKIKVYKDNNTIMIDKLELNKYLKNGYKKGLHYKTVSGFKNWIKDKKGNMRTIHKNGITKRILKEQLEYYLQEGWIRGYHYKAKNKYTSTKNL